MATLLNKNEVIINQKKLKWNSIKIYEIMKTVTKIILIIRKFNDGKR